MKKIAVLFLMLTTLLVEAQTTIPITGFQSNLLWYNPATAGENEYIDFSILQKTQWTSVKTNPSVLGLSLATPIRYERYGTGLTIINESSGIQQYLSVNTNFAYKLNYAQGRLAFGLKIGMVQWSESYDKLTIRDEEAIPSFRKILPNTGGGMFYKDKKKQIGLSCEYTPGMYQGASALPKVYYTGMLLFVKKITTSILVYPGTLIRYTKGFKPVTIFSLPLEYKKFLWTGLYYRTTSTLSLMAGINIDRLLKNNRDKIKLLYYYDFNMDKLASVLANTHELSLFFQFGKGNTIESIKRKRVTVSPVFFD